MHPFTPFRGSPCPRRSARVSALCAAGALLVLGLAAAAADSSRVPEGFAEHTLLHYANDGTWGFGGLAVLPDGSLIVFDGTNVVHHGANGAAPRVLFTPDDSPVFGNFFRIAPDGASVYFGVNHVSASSAPHSIYRLPIDPVTPGAVEEADVLRLNFDLAFDDKGRGFISSYAQGGENRIYLLDNDPKAENDPVVVGIPGYSGPVVFHDGKLFYATAQWGVPNAVVYFTADDLESGIGAGKEFAFQTAIDRGQVLTYEAGSYFSLISVGGRLFGSNLAGPGSIDRLDPDGTITTFAALPASFLAFRPGARAFEPGAGPEGGTLYACASDYMTYSDVVTIQPELFFRRAYINEDARVDIADAIALLEYLFQDGRSPDPVVAGDVNDDGSVDVADVIFTLSYLFADGAPPPEPFANVGADPTP